ncbi:MAG: peptidoglycan DD-metalloendopeptidase family protein [Brevinema sp.]
MKALLMQLTENRHLLYKPFKTLSIPHMIISGMILIIFFSLSLSKTEQAINTGDSPLTSTIIDKEFISIANAEPIENKDDLEKIASKTPLGFVFYRIRAGENLSSVAEKFGLSMATVLSLNSLDNAHWVSVGQKVLLSTKSGIIVNLTNNESIQTLAERYGISAEETKLVNKLNSNIVTAGRTLFLPNANLSFKAMSQILGFQFINPVSHYRRISSHFGWRRHPVLGYRKLHTGTDFAAPVGTPVHAAKEGRVIYADWNGGYGMFISIRHNNGYTTSYAHLSRIHIKKGDWVNAGQRIGSSGNTGRSTGPHLHFELRKYGQPKNALLNGLQLR